MSKIITKEELIAHIGETPDNDAKAQSVVDAVNAWIEAYTGRIFGETKQLDEISDYAPVIFLNRVDIVSVDKVILHGNKLNSDDYKFSKDTGRLLLNKFGRNDLISRYFYDAVEVQYTAGIEDTPTDLKLAALQLASDNYYRADDASGKITAEQIGTYRVQYEQRPQEVLANAQSGTQSRMTDYMAVFNFYKVRGL